MIQRFSTINVFHKMCKKDSEKSEKNLEKDFKYESVIENDEASPKTED